MTELETLRAERDAALESARVAWGEVAAWQKVHAKLADQHQTAITAMSMAGRSIDSALGSLDHETEKRVRERIDFFLSGRIDAAREAAGAN